MHPSPDVSRDKLPRSRVQCANHFSFPPTQRHGLLDPTSSLRSSNQRANLMNSYRSLLDALNVPTLQHITA